MYPWAIGIADVWFSMEKNVHTIMTIIVMWDVTSCIQNYTTVKTVVYADIAL